MMEKGSIPLFSRRQACGGMVGLFTGLMAGWAGPMSPVNAQSAGEAESLQGAIDLHHHFLPKAYVEQMGAARIGNPAPNGRMPPWTPEQSLALMDRLGVAKAIVSISAPGVWLGDGAASAQLARQCNDDAARLVAANPKRFGFFASLPLPDVPAALAELTRALDVLKADGVVLMTNYADQYLGDPMFAPVMDELDRRGALVFIHPNDCSCNALLAGVPASVVDFPQDTTRAVASLLYSGTFLRCKRIRFVLSHAGGTLPFLGERLAAAAGLVPTVSKEVAADAPRALRSLYFDTALSTNAVTLAALQKFVPLSQLVFGSDYPFAPEQVIAGGVRSLGKQGWSAVDLKAITHGNAGALLAKTDAPSREGSVVSG